MPHPAALYRPTFWRALLLAGVIGLFLAPAASAAEGEKAPVNFTARRLFHDDKAQTVTAAGDVEFVQGQRVLRADRMVYHLDTDTVEAIGNVSLLNDDGSVHFSEYVQLTQDMHKGFVHSLLSMLNDGARFTAVEAVRDGTKTSMIEATYTPCRVCETDPKPTWQLKADEITHDTETKEVKYKNARLELLGVPLAWTPVFSHADPSVKRRSGFLRPNFGWTNNLGGFAEAGYYYDIAPDKDATFRLRPTMRAGVLTQGEWRQRFRDGRIRLFGNFAQSDHLNEDGTTDQNQWRGSLAGEGLFDLDEKWRAGFDVQRVSDKEYLRLYDLDDRDILENEVYAERFSGRDYSRLSLVDAQDLRLGIRPVQPRVLPMAEHHMLGEPQSLLGGRWAMDLSTLDLQRMGSGQDMQRGSVTASWERRDVHAPSGVATTWKAGVAGDGYTVQNNAAAAGDNTAAARGRAFAGVTASYPLVRPVENGQAVIEPLLGFNASTRADNDPAEFPDEDSLNVQIDPNSLFDSSRFPGTDRQEDGARVDYGLRSGLYGDDGRYGKVFVGQSYRIDGPGSDFPAGSGLDERLSDVVGQVGVGIEGVVSADYRVQLDNGNLSSRRHEVQATGEFDRLRLSTRFIYLDAVAGTGFIVPREQLQLGGSFSLTDKWTFTGGTLADFGEDHGVRRASVAFSYVDDCFTFSAQGRRNLITEASGESGTSVMLRVGLKNIGEFSSPEINLRPLPADEIPPPP